MEERDNPDATDTSQDPRKREQVDIEPLVGTVQEPIRETQAVRHAELTVDVDEIPNTVELSAIEGKSGDFLFTVGATGSGKSTIQSFLVHRLASHPSVVYTPASADGDPKNDAYLNGWVQNIANGFFPRRTERGQVREFNISFGQASRRTLDLSFIEIAGEDIHSIVPTVESHERENLRLSQHLEQYLREPHVNKRFMFITDAGARGSGKDRQSPYSDDILFCTLIRYLLSDTGIGLKRLDILFVVSKWDQIKNDYRTHKQYFKSHFPNTLATVAKSSRIKSSFMPFSVGEVDTTDQSTPRILRKERKYVDTLISWIYESFSQRRLEGFPRVNKSLWERIKDFFAGLS